MQGYGTHNYLCFIVWKSNPPHCGKEYDSFSARVLACGQIVGFGEKGVDIKLFGREIEKFIAKW
jgi:hypothetical protein